MLTACGFDEALTISVVDDAALDVVLPWTDAAPLALQMPILERADKLRRSLVPSLLKARRDNEAVGNRTIELFETAKVYLPRAGATAARRTDARPHERRGELLRREGNDRSDRRRARTRRPRSKCDGEVVRRCSPPAGRANCCSTAKSSACWAK